MPRFYHLLAAGLLALSATASASAEPARPLVRADEFACFRGLEASQIDYLPALSHKTPQMRLQKLGNSKYDNTDGHDLREVKTEGDYRILVILVNFKDVKFNTSWGDSKELINDMLNGQKFRFQGATGSVNDYYRRVSSGKFNPIFDVAGPVTLSKNEMDYVTTNPDDLMKDEDGNPVMTSGKPTPVYSPGRMVEEAVKLLEDQVDFTQYDSDDDGLVDFVYLFFAGVSATTGGDRIHNIWPHAFTLTSALGAPVEVDGVKVNRYCTSSELGSAHTLAGIGTFCHEFAHVLGLPDNYDTANNNGTASSCFTPGCYSAMDAGYYNNNEHTPPLYSSYEQYSLEWMKPAELSGTGRYTLLPIEARSFGYKVASPANPQEYFLLEARGNSYLDQYLKGHGLLVWHIDFDLEVWDSNKPNNDVNHQRIDVVEADNVKSEGTRDGDTFPGVSGICEFTKGVTPAFKDWKGNTVGYDLRNIRSDFDGTVSFDAKGSAQILPEAELSAPVAKVTAASANSLDIEWLPVENATGYYISVYDANKFDGSLLPYSAYAEGYYFRDLGNVEAVDGVCHATLSDLPANMKCGIMLYAINDLNASRADAPVYASTVDGADFDKAATNVRLFGATEGFTIAEWDAVADADEYQLIVASRAIIDSNDSELCDFTDSALPKGWDASGKYESRKVGNAAPSYALQAPGAYIQSAIYDKPISGISFWACRRYSDPGAQLSIFALDKQGNPSLVTIISDPSNKGEEIMVNMPAEAYGFRFSYNFCVTDLHLYVDDINITFSEGHSDAPAADAVIEYDGNSAKISGLEANQQYVAYVYPVKNGERGAKSNEVFFTPSALEISGVESVTDGLSAADFHIYGQTIQPSDASLSYNIFAADGATVALGCKGAFTLPAKGIYIVTTNGRAIKFVI